MLDDMAALRDAAANYRAAALAVGVTWPDHPYPNGGQPPNLVYRLFDVDHVAEQLVWFQSQGWHSQPVLPDAGWVLPWPTDAGESLDNLSFSIGTPFPWRQQLPLFHFERSIYTFVLAGEHEGEIWRYEASPDLVDSVCAATSLATLLTEWTKGIATGAVFYREWLIVGDDVNDPFDVLQEIEPDLDPFAFPVSISNEAMLRARQAECDVDMECVDRGAEYQEELLDAIDAVRGSLGV